jgi:hypothetical protein
MQVEVQKEHRWLHKLVGEWTSESECQTAPDQPTQTLRGTESVRTIGDIWVQCEGSGEMPGGGKATMVMTLGYDSHKQRFVGTWIGSMMNHLWIYDGSLDSNEKVLSLESDGPAFSDDGKPIEGKFARYRDAIEFKSDEHRVLTSCVRGEDGKWSEPFVTVHYRRTK